MIMKQYHIIYVFFLEILLGNRIEYNLFKSKLVEMKTTNENNKKQNKMDR